MAKNVSVLGRKVRRFSTVQSVLALGLVGISGSGCSDFLASNCRETRSCPHDHDAAAGGADAGAAVSDHGGSAGTGGSAGAGGSGVAAGGIAGEGSGGEGSGGKPQDTTDGAAGEPSVDAGVDSGSDASRGGGSDAGGDSAPLICATGLADCNLDSRDGCEAVLASSAAHCGACGHACSSNGATAKCDSGVCKPACLPGHADCNKNPDDGCEVDLTKDTSSCGACGHACGTQNTLSPLFCAAGVCKPTCAKGYVDCRTPANTAQDDGCETDLTSKVTCGACGHDCLGGDCKAQMCVPLQLTSALESATGLAADSKGVYWTDRTGGMPRVMRTSLIGTGETLVASDDVGDIPDPLVSNGAYVVWPTKNTAGDPPNGKLRRLASGSSDILDIATGVDVSALTMDATNVYYTGSDNQTHQVALERSGTTILGAVTGAAMVVDAKSLYFVDGVINLRSLTLATRQSYEVTPSPNIYSTRLAQDAQNLYTWSYNSQDAAISLMRMAKTFQGSPTVVTRATSGGAYAPIVVDGTYAYFGQRDGVYRVPTTGGTAQLLASATDYPVQIVLNGGAIYWIDADASSGMRAIKKLAVFSN